MGFERVNADDLTAEQLAELRARATDINDLPAEQRELLENVQRFEELKRSMEEAQNAIHREARRQSRWIETQIWTTDYSEVAVLDVVTFLPLAPGQTHDIKAFRYASEGDAPEEGSYSDRSGMQTQVQRVHREEFVEVVEEHGIDPPDYIPNARVWDGEHGADEDTEREGPEIPDAREE